MDCISWAHSLQLYILIYFGNMLSEQRVKTITMHSRKEAIFIFQQLRNKLNKAYEWQSQSAFAQLASTLQIIYYLYPLPLFIQQINSIGSIPISALLERLYIKIKMMKVSYPMLHYFTIKLLLEIKNVSPEMDVNYLQEEKDINEIYNSNLWVQGDIVEFIGVDLIKAVESHDSGAAVALIMFLKNLMIFSESNLVDMCWGEEQKWQKILIGLIKACQFIDNMSYEELGVSICYQLCEKMNYLCKEAIENDIVGYLSSLLESPQLKPVFSKRIIRLLQLLFGKLSKGECGSVRIKVLERGLCNLMQVDGDEIVRCIQDLVYILEKKTDLVDCVEKMQELEGMSEEKTSEELNESQKFNELLSTLHLYANTLSMKGLINKYYQKLFLPLLEETKNIKTAISILKIISNPSLMNKDHKIVESILKKSSSILSEDSNRQELLRNDRRLLLNLLAVMKRSGQNVVNKEYFLQLMNKYGIEELLQRYADSTFLPFQRQLLKYYHRIGLKRKANMQDKYKQVYSELEVLIINKSKFNAKHSKELCEELLFLNTLLLQSHQELSVRQSSTHSQVSPELFAALLHFIHPQHLETNTHTLHNLELHQSENVRKQLNIVATNLLEATLSKIHLNTQQIQSAKKKIIQLATQDQTGNLSQILYTILNRLQSYKLQRVSYVIPQKQMNKEAENLFLKQLFYEYFLQKGSINDILEATERYGIQKILEGLTEYQSEEYILDYLKIIQNLSMKEAFCDSITALTNSKLFPIYQYLISKDQKPTPSVLILEDIFYKLNNHHLHLSFEDIFNSACITFAQTALHYLQTYVLTVFTSKKLQLISHVTEYLQMNGINCREAIVSIIENQNFVQAFKKIIENRQTSAINMICGQRMSLQKAKSNKQQGDHSKSAQFLMRFREDLFDQFKQPENMQCLKFIASFMHVCDQNSFHEYNLERLVQMLLVRYKNIVTAEPNHIDSHTLRPINYSGRVLARLSERKDLNLSFEILANIESYLIDSIVFFMNIKQIQRQCHFKHYFADQTIPIYLNSLITLYKNNFKMHNLEVQRLEPYLNSVIAIDNEEIQLRICQMMKILLLKGNLSIITNECYICCKDYVDSLSQGAKEQMQQCFRLSELIQQKISLKEQINEYFAVSINNKMIENEELIIIQHKEEFQQKQQVISEDITESKPDVQVVKQREVRGKEGMNVHKKEQGVMNEEQGVSYLEFVIKGEETFTMQRLLAIATVKSQEGYNKLIQLFFYVQANKNIHASIPQAQSKIIELLPQEHCKNTPRFYQLMALNLIGASICLKNKHIHLKGIQILAEKMIASIDDQQISRYAYLISQCLTETQQIKLLKELKLYEVVNHKINFLTKNQESILNLCKLIESTCKYQPFKNAYEVSEQLSQKLIQNKMSKSNTLHIAKALAALTDKSEKHKQAVNGTELIKVLEQKLQDYQTLCQEERECFIELLYSIVDNNSLAAQKCQDLSVEQTIINILRGEVESNSFNEHLFKMLLKILQMLAALPQSAIRILRAKFMNLSISILKLSETHQKPAPTLICLSILAKMIQEMQLNVSRVITELQKQGLVDYLFGIKTFVLKSNSVQILLQLFCSILALPAIAKKSLPNIMTLIQLMIDVLQSCKLTNMQYQKWTKMLFNALEIQRYSQSDKIIKSNIFYLASNSLKRFQSISENNLSMNLRIIKELNTHHQLSNALIAHGFFHFVVQTMKMTNLSVEEYLKLINMFIMMPGIKLLPSSLCTKLFEIAVRQLQKSELQEIKSKSITVLKLIKEKVEITSQFSQNMVTFFCTLLTQSTKESSLDHYATSRELICMVIYFIIRNQQIKSYFKDNTIISVLKNWLKNSKVLELDMMTQTYKLLMYALYQDEAAILDKKITPNIKNVEEIMKNGFECNLFRLNGSYKKAILKLDKNGGELVVFKNPDGIIKDKYRLPVKNILIVYDYMDKTSFLFQESSFNQTINIFQHTVIQENCISIFCLTEKDEVREISIQFPNIVQKSKVKNMMCNLVESYLWGQSRKLINELELI